MKLNLKKKLEENTAQDGKVGVVNLGNTLLFEKAKDTTNKLESVPFSHPLFKNVYEIPFRQEMSMELSLHGECGIGLIESDFGWIPVIVKEPVYSAVGKNLISVRGITGLYTYENTVYDLYTCWEFENGKVKISRSIEIKSKKETRIVIIDDATGIYDFNVLPVEVFKNNFESKSDVDFYGVNDLVSQLNRVSNFFEREFYRTRTNFIFNELFTDMDPQKTMKEIDSGKNKFLAETRPESKLGAGFIPVAATNGADNNLALAYALQTELRDKLAMSKKASDTGSNKHTIEIIDKDNYHLDEILNKRITREQHYFSLFEKWAKITGEEAEFPEQKLSRILQAKIDLMDASVMEAQMVSQNKTSQIESTTVEEEV